MLFNIDHARQLKTGKFKDWNRIKDWDRSEEWKNQSFIPIRWQRRKRSEAWLCTFQGVFRYPEKRKPRPNDKAVFLDCHSGRLVSLPLSPALYEALAGLNIDFGDSLIISYSRPRRASKRNFPSVSPVRGGCLLPPAGVIYDPRKQRGYR